MHILITGANGYVGQRLSPVLVELGHRITCCVRSRQRFNKSLQVKGIRHCNFINVICCNLRSDRFRVLLFYFQSWVLALPKKISFPHVLFQKLKLCGC
ncbi:NAD-dependent epimerase/dehydratase family protein [Niastella koreensis]|uniref:NAD-dependent epimerase/dehydratase family protein n=1 Tax=Niastella koreensis TaxID=354356 RepID=UPI0009BF5FFA|nr:NAD-dependent epimerase/dehydratase family protein [Niastella koreensis]